MRGRLRTLAWAGPLVLTGIGVLLVLPLGWPSGVQKAGAWVVMAGAIGLWLGASSSVKIWLERGADTPARRRSLVVLARTPVRVCLALVAFPLMVGWLVGVNRLLGAQDGSILVGVIDNAFMGFLATGAAFFAYSFVRRGDEPRCRACQYDLSGAPEDGYAKCPECGASLRFSPAIVRGSRRVIVPMIVVGVVFAALGITSLFKLRPLVYVPHLPTGTLIEEATEPLGFSSMVWKELTSRQLTRGQTEALFEGLLEQRETRMYSAGDAEEWLDASVRTGSLPEGLFERYYDGTLTLWIAAPNSISADETLRFGVGGDYRGSMWTNNRRLAAFFLAEEVTINGQAPEPEQVRLLGIPLQGQMLGTAQSQPYGAEVDRNVPAHGGPMVTVPMDEYAGLAALELRVVGTMFFVDFSTTPGWGPPTLGDAIWSKRVDLRKTVRIEN